MNALRLNSGFAESLFTARTGLQWSRAASTVHRLAAQGLLESPASGRWQASRRGRELLNDVVQCFLPGPNSEAAARS